MLLRDFFDNFKFYNVNNNWIIEESLNKDKNLCGILDNSDSNFKAFYTKDKKINFLYKDFFISDYPENIIFENILLNENERIFRIKNSNELIYEEKYDRKVTISMLIIDEEEEDYDFLLYISQIAESISSMNNFIAARSSC